MKTLIVEDDNMMRRILKRAAMALGYEVAGCIDAEHALDLIENQEFKLVILDWMLPGMSGLDLLKRVKEAMPGLTWTETREWMGHRPAPSDSIPLIGEVPGAKGAYLGFGHHHVGLTGGPKTGRILAGLISGLASTARAGATRQADIPTGRVTMAVRLVDDLRMSGFERRAPIRIGDLSNIEILVTDEGIPGDAAELCRQHGVRLEIAGQDSDNGLAAMGGD